jgi:branched-chain amino acid transport system ATP-binding protein
MNPHETAELEDMVRRICLEDHVAILLIEHDMRIVMSLSDHIVVLDYGERIAEGTAREIQGNPRVIKAYLGEDEEG